MKLSKFVAAALGSAILALAGCEPGQNVDTSKPLPRGSLPDEQVTLVEEGRKVYQTYCVGCHGAAGDGNGDAARFMHPPPRNFVLANFKFSSTRSGQLPSDDDLKRTIRLGLRGSAMPAFPLLPDRSIDSLVAFLKTLSPKWKEQGAGTPIPVVEDPYRALADKSEAIQRGEAVYHGYAVCWSCHPAYVPEAKINEYLVAFGSPAREGFRPGLYEAEGKPNVEGVMLYPPDFKHDHVRAGVKVGDLYRSIAAGITGTAMPTWVDSIDLPGQTPSHPPLVSKNDLWAMAYYVQSLIAARPPLWTESALVVRDRPRPILRPGETYKPIEPSAEVPQGAGDAPVIAQPTDDDFNP